MAHYVQTHSYLYTLESSRRHAAVTFLAGEEGTAAPPVGQSVFRVSSIFSHSTSDSSSRSPSSDNLHSPMTLTTHQAPPPMNEEEEENPKLTVKFAFALLLVVTSKFITHFREVILILLVLTGLTAEFLVDSIDGMPTLLA